MAKKEWGYLPEHKDDERRRLLLQAESARRDEHKAGRGLCRECGSDDLRNHGGFVKCEDCGEVST